MSQIEEHAKAVWRPEWSRKAVAEQPLRVVRDDEEFTLCGRTFIAWPHVFSPRIYRDPDVATDEFFVAELTKVVESITKPTIRLLEIGCGTGCLSISVTLNCARVLACGVDISPAAVGNATANAALNGVADRYVAETSDLFGAFEGKGNGGMFDVIYFDFPFGQIPAGSTDRDVTLDVAFCSPYYTLLHRFLESVAKHLAADGRVLVKFSRALGVYDAFVAIVHAYKWMCTEIACVLEHEADGVVVDFDLYELVQC